MDQNKFILQNLPIKLTILKRNKDIFNITENIVGSGANGEILETCVKKNCKYVAKIQNKSIENFYSELFCQIKSSEIGISPQIYEIILNEQSDEKIFIMDRIFGITLEEYLKLPNDLIEKKEMIKKSTEILDILHKIGIQHGDSHLNNFIVKHDGKLNIIDFEHSNYEHSSIQFKDKAKMDKLTLFTDIKNTFPYLYLQLLPNNFQSQITPFLISIPKKHDQSSPKRKTSSPKKPSTPKRKTSSPKKPSTPKKKSIAEIFIEIKDLIELGVLEKSNIDDELSKYEINTKQKQQLKNKISKL